MPQYLLSIYQPDGNPPPPEILDPIMRDMERVREEMKAAGAWVFSGALHLASTATVIRLRDNEPMITDGPYTEGKEHVGGFIVLRAPDLDAALEWGGKVTRALRLPIEVRPLQADVS
jgi:hypothetical protein